MPNVLPFLFTVRTESSTKVEVKNTQKAGNVEVETRVETDASSATVKATLKNVKVGPAPVDLSLSTNKSQNGTKTKVEAKTGTNNIKAGAVVEVETGQNGEFKSGKVGVLVEVKEETSNGSVIKTTQTVGKTF